MKKIASLIFALIILATESQAMFPLSASADIVDDIDAAITPQNINGVMERTGRPVLVEVVTWGRPDQLERILNLKPNLHVCTPQGQTALHAAAQNSRDGDFKLHMLLEHARKNNISHAALIEATMGTDYFTPLCIAVGHLNVSNVRILLQAGANVNVKPGWPRRGSILDCPCMDIEQADSTRVRNLPECIELLCSHGMTITNDMYNKLYSILVAHCKSIKARMPIYLETKQILKKYHVQQELLRPAAKKDTSLLLSQLPPEILAEVSRYFLYKPKIKLTFIRES